MTAASLFASVNGLPVTDMTIVIPYLGRIVIDAKIDTSTAIASGAGALAIALGDLTITATDFRSAPFLGIVSSRAVSGFGGWSKPYGPTPFANDGGLTLSYVLGQVSAAVGEKMNVAADATFGTFMAVPLAPAIRTLNLLARNNWWQDTAGVTNVGPRAATMIASPFDVLDYEPSRGLFTMATDTLSDWTPGARFSSVNGLETVSTVIHSIDSSAKVRTLVQVLP